MESEIKVVKHFIEDFREKDSMLVDFRIRHDLAHLRHFFSSFRQIDNIAIKLIEKEAPKFNLFEILNIKRYEAKVHTPFLANLLSPNETHRQRMLFFSAFMELLFGGNYIAEQVSDVSVKEEIVDSANGRMDIFIYYVESGVSKAIVIENKIYHHDEEMQLERYYRSLTKTYNYKDGEYHLVYLTPNKAKPTSTSITESTYNILKKKNALTELGYKVDIAPMFRNLLQSIAAPVVKETVSQYIKTIKSL